MNPQPSTLNPKPQKVVATLAAEAAVREEAEEEAAEEERAAAAFAVAQARSTLNPEPHTLNPKP